MVTHPALRERLLRWEQTQFDEAVTDVFGYHALQLGLPELASLQNSRIAHRWVMDSVGNALASTDSMTNELLKLEKMTNETDFFSELTSLPFSDSCLDLVTLPHTLENSPDAHATLREVSRVLIPEGKVMIMGLNPSSLWSLQNPKLMLHSAIAEPQKAQQPLQPRQWIAYWRLRDWLRLLDFEVESAKLWGYGPALTSALWLERLQGLDQLGARWWPILGGVYFLVATKRVRGARLIGKAWQQPRAAKSMPPSPVPLNKQRTSIPLPSPAEH
jgi:SAM-dependent methyltransferase